MTHPTPDQPPSVMSGKEAHAYFCGYTRPETRDLAQSSWRIESVYRQIQWDRLAAEISRRAVADWKNCYSHEIGAVTEALAAANATIARLKESLKEIAKEQSAKTAAEAADRFQSIARQALETEERE